MSKTNHPKPKPGLHKRHGWVCYGPEALFVDEHPNIKLPLRIKLEGHILDQEQYIQRLQDRVARMKSMLEETPKQ